MVKLVFSIFTFLEKNKSNSNPFTDSDVNVWNFNDEQPELFLKKQFYSEDLCVCSVK